MRILLEPLSSYTDFTPESVPRFTKRPGDLVLQGSNNTAIMLGQDRGWTRADADVSPDKADPTGKELSNSNKTDEDLLSDIRQPSGTIDVVAGRGRYTFHLLGGTVDSAPSLTAAATVEVTPPKEDGRAPYIETNKNPAGMKLQVKNRKFNPTEGDPDFDNDAARLYLSMATAVDKNFYINEPGKNIPHPFEETDFKVAVGPAGKEKPSGGDGIPTVADYVKPAVLLGKSDEIRLIARRKKKDKPVAGAPEINGSIRFYKGRRPKR